MPHGTRIAPSRSSPRHGSGSRSAPPLPANVRQRSWTSGGTASARRPDIPRGRRVGRNERMYRAPPRRRVEIARQQHDVVRADVPGSTVPRRSCAMTAGSADDRHERGHDDRHRHDHDPGAVDELRIGHDDQHQERGDAPTALITIERRHPFWAVLLCASPSPSGGPCRSATSVNEVNTDDIELDRTGSVGVEHDDQNAREHREDDTPLEKPTARGSRMTGKNRSRESEARRGKS